MTTAAIWAALVAAVVGLLALFGRSKKQEGKADAKADQTTERADSAREATQARARADAANSDPDKLREDDGFRLPD